MNNYITLLGFQTFHLIQVGISKFWNEKNRYYYIAIV